MANRTIAVEKPWNRMQLGVETRKKYTHWRAISTKYIVYLTHRASIYVYYLREVERVSDIELTRNNISPPLHCVPGRWHWASEHPTTSFIKLNNRRDYLAQPPPSSIVSFEGKKCLFRALALLPPSLRIESRALARFFVIP